MPRVASILVALLLAACGSGDSHPGGSAADASPFDLPDGGIGGHVTVSRAGVDIAYVWPNVACHPDGSKYFMRVARSSQNNGEDDLHVDVDVCGFTGPGSYPPANPMTTPCPGAPFFDVFWHAADGVFFNDATATACTLDVGGDAVELTVNLRCDGLVRPIASPDRVSVRVQMRCPRG